MGRSRRRFFSVALIAALTASSASARAADEPVTSSGFMMGASVDYLAPQIANLFPGGSAGPGPGVGVHAGYRWRLLYFGAAYEHGFLTGAGDMGHDGTPLNVSAASTDFVGVDIDTISAPDAVISFITHFSVGYRVVNVTSTCCFSSVPTTAPNAGPEVMLVGLGLQLNAGGWLRLQPEASLAFGPDAIVSVGMTAFFDLGTPR